jgi:hypothetical protein
MAAAVVNMVTQTINGGGVGQYDPGGRRIIKCYLPIDISAKANVENGGPRIYGEV